MSYEEWGKIFFMVSELTTEERKKMGLKSDDVLIECTLPLIVRKNKGDFEFIICPKVLRNCSFELEKKT